MLSTKILLFLGAFAACSIFTALLCRWAPRIGLVDKPDERRKMHGRLVPLGGGIAISAAMALCMGILAIFPNTLRVFFDGELLAYGGYVLSAFVLVTVGVIDDRFGLRGRVKLAGQIVSALILIAGGLVIRNIAMFGWSIELGLLSVPFTLFWLLGAINALNLLDGIDGMATTVGLILVSSIAVMARLTGSNDVQVVAIAFAGCLLGFLRYNFPPAKIFLGDAGSMLIGLIVGALAIEASLKGPGTVLLAAPLAIWAIPILDSGAAIVRRKLTGRSIYTTDRGHLHHRLLDRLGCNRRALRRVALMCTATGLAALFSVFMHNDLFALVTCLAVIGVMLATDTFGRAESLLLVKRAGRLGRSMVASGRANRQPDIADTIHLQGNRPWDILWESLAEAGEKFDLLRVHLDINIPALHESFSATWRGQDSPEPEYVWAVEMPLIIRDQVAGRLDISGQRNSEYPRHEMEGLMDLLDAFESRMVELIYDEPSPSRDETELLVAVGETDSETCDARGGPPR
jgi:UDP-GlcNAc:undecaprenyl-phosphate/decaprenyl-phosphate GlcNAc-1-phosphate transferase